ncbi:MAG: DUF433 domain-containing protein [Dehalococcoidia bacterium]|nr:DUF433 domain-containing protein [Dehalococcoidia bacterium]MDW8120306.1 DUF433 domain-containing protein [Chloroflexota bacterium]
MEQARIVIDPAICHGKPVVRGTRIMVENILSLLAGGYTIGQILEYYPELSEEDVRAALEYALRVVREEEMIMER